MAGKKRAAVRMRVMVTGATGYVGAHSVKALVDAGHEVRMLVRNRAKAATVLRAVGVAGKLDCVQGDMTDEAAVLRALKGCDAALHCAAVVSTAASRADEMLRANVTGTELVVGHAARLGLDPVVYVSSVAALLRPGVERLTSDMPLGTLDSGYARSKAAAERYVRAWQSEGAPVVITYPGSVTGPAAGDILGEATQGIVSMFELGALPTRNAAWSLIDARDLGAIHAALMVPGHGPRRIMCGGHYLSMGDVARQFRELTGRNFPVLRVPGRVLRGLGLAVDTAARFASFDSVFTYEAMVCFTQMPPTDDSAVRRELRIRYRNIRDTLRESILAAHRVGLLDAKQIGKLARHR
jgi:nucleoside-diphosphate-sugar epimerase